MTRLLTAIALITAALAGCGGGGGGSGIGGLATSAFNGVAVDGYLHNARAFLDLNNNGTYDAGEPTAMTNSTGGFTLEATQAQIDAYPVVVVAIAGTTIDQDSPGAPMTSGMTLMSPPGNHSVVSPLTTQVVAKMATGLSLADAKTAVQTDLGLTGVDLMKDFVAEKTTNPAYAEAHRIAVSVADVLKTVESESTSSTTLTDRLANARSKVTSDVVPQVALIKQATSNEEALVAMKAITWQSSGNLANYDNCNDGSASIALDVSGVNKNEITYSIAEGALPLGLSLSADGKITGIPSFVLNDAISTFKVIASRSGANQSTSSNLSISVRNGGVFYNSTNHHYYRYVTAAGLTWLQARDLAAASTCRSFAGYLTTITTDQELNFIDTVMFPSVNKPDFMFIGAADIDGTRNWRWVTGPESLLAGGHGPIFYDANWNSVQGYISPWLSNTDAHNLNYVLSDNNRYAGIFSSHIAKFQPWNGSIGSTASGGASGYLVEYGQ